MQKLKKIILSKFFWIFILLHLFLININYAEWGDSYRILRASEFIRKFSYPEDEKRQPLFSLLLALRPSSIDQVTWGRYEMLGISIAFFIVFYLFLDLLELNPTQKKLSLILFILNPVFLYWSLRIMSDAFFALIVLLAYYFLILYKNNQHYKKFIILGILSGISFLIRFEGVILGLSLGIFLLKKMNWKFSRDNFKKIVVFILSGLVTILPWLIYRNPFSSSYLEEPAGRAYDLNMFITYISSLLYIFGFSTALFFIIASFKKVKEFITKYLEFFIFIVFELVLALLWPAAIPRLFVPIIPFLIIYLAIGIDFYYEKDKKITIWEKVLILFLCFLPLLIQYKLKLQFLVLFKEPLLIIFVLQIISVFFILKRAFLNFYIILFLTLFIWTLSTVFLHKDIFKSVVNANKYLLLNIKGNVIYNDVSSVSDWYLNMKDTSDNLSGSYFNLDDKKGRSLKSLSNKNADYLLLTNEHNTSLSYNIQETPYLEEVKEFKYEIRGKVFFTKILKVKK